MTTISTSATSGVRGPQPPSVTHYIYYLKDPVSGDVRYVGQTVNLTQRMYRHKGPAGSRLWDWLCSLKQEPELQSVCILQNRSEALRVERELVDRLKRRGVDLLNVTWSVEERQRHSRTLLEAHKNQPGVSAKSKETKRRMSEAARESWKDGSRKGTPRDMSKTRAARWPK